LQITIHPGVSATWAAFERTTVVINTIQKASRKRIRADIFISSMYFSGILSIFNGASPSIGGTINDRHYRQVSEKSKRLALGNRLCTPPCRNDRNDSPTVKVSGFGIESHEKEPTQHR
jgi:hypothetical protein